MAKAPRKRSRVHQARPTALDLFSGPGGLSEGLKQAGFNVLGAIEIDDLATETYRLNHRSTQLWPVDIRKLDVVEVLRKLNLQVGELDLLAGCPPCQGFSTLTTLNGRKRSRDPRNDLVSEFLRFVRGLRPKAVMMENVPGLATKRRFAELVKGLEGAGYICDYRVLDAAGFGVPQRRKRLILFAGLGRAIEFAESRRLRRTVRQAIEGLPAPGTSGDPLHDHGETRSAKIQALIARIPADGGSRSSLGAEGQLKCHKKIEGFHDVYGRMMWDGVSPTITGGCINPSKGRFLHPSEHRSITLREAALLQTFPPNYKISMAGGKYRAAEMIGNALPPELIRVQSLQVLRYLKDSGSMPMEAKPYARNQRRS